MGQTQEKHKDRLCGKPIGQLQRLRDALTTAGYTEEAVGETIRSAKASLPLLMRTTSSPSPYHTVVRLFRVGVAVSADAARLALHPADLEELAQAKIIAAADDGRVRASFALSPIGEDLLVAHDFEANLTGGPMFPNQVLGVGPASRTLAAMTVRRENERVLDLCCGGGIQGLLAGRHASMVIGTDINSRAKDFVTLNAHLNQVKNLQFREGYQYQPVHKEKFDLIVANPPYVISPASSYAYRDSGLQGDIFSEQVIREAPNHVEENGYCSVIFNWHHSRVPANEEGWAARVLQWVDGNSCDVWLLRFETEDPLQYAVSWLEPEERALTASEYSAALDGWLNYYERNGIESISMGVLVMRRRSSSKNWLRLESSLPEWRKEECSAAILRIFAAEDLLQQIGADDEALLSRRLLTADDHELTQTMRVSDGGWVLDSATLRHTRAFGFGGRVDANVMLLLSLCDGHRSLREAAQQIATKLEVPPEKVTDNAAAVGRGLIRAGFLIDAAAGRFQS
jgi:SAM-dependent methyltransferase